LKLVRCQEISLTTTRQLNALVDSVAILSFCLRIVVSSAKPPCLHNDIRTMHPSILLGGRQPLSTFSSWILCTQRYAILFKRYMAHNIVYCRRRRRRRICSILSCV